MKILLSIVLTLACLNVQAQESSKIFTSDIDNFWVAYDSIRQTDDFGDKLELINRLYIHKGTKGLGAFMKARDYNDTLYVKLIDAYPKYWDSIRSNTLAVNGKSVELNEAVSNFKRLYPELKDAEMYFTIGGLRSGGTVMSNMVLVGAEIATGTPDVDMSEFKDDWLRSVFAKQTLDNIVSINIHEYVHTQQKPGNGRVLNQSIREGSCDFITELVLDRPIKSQHLLHGKSRADTIKAQFKKEMFSHDFGNWLYNGGQKGEEADLGYYVGYEISKSYYENSNDKTQAVKDIIELDFADDEAVEAFLIRSGYFKELIDKKVLVQQYEESLPYIVEVGPFANGSESVDPELKELRITFSKAMNTKGMSFNYTDRGSDYFPITKLKGYEDGDKTMVLFMELKPGTEYEFLITNQGFRSSDGYRLKDEAYLVKFKTR
jgi:hypothetical protein